MPAQPHQTTRKPAPARDSGKDKGAYGARINQLFRDAIRDLEELKQSPLSQPPE